MRPSQGKGGNACRSSFKPVISHFKRKPCRFGYFIILIALFSVTLSLIAFSTRLCVVCHHLCGVMLPFQGDVACRNLTLSGPYLSIPMKVYSCMIVSCVLHFSSEYR